MGKVQRALISVYRKDGIVELARFLVQQGIEIITTGGTARLLKENRIPMKEIAEYTGSPEIMDGRVKTLHPKVHGGILGLREKEDHQRQAESLGISWIDLVVVNLYPFAETIARPGCTLEEAIENIDIGGPSMLRSAAKNHRYVTVVTDPDDYPRIMEDIRHLEGAVSDELRRNCAVKAFAMTSTYDSLISAYLSGQALLPDALSVCARKTTPLRYGENPHQQGALYSTGDGAVPSIVSSRLLNGKELSYNNILDLDAALRLALEFQKPAGVVIKHGISCGVAVRASLAEAVTMAIDGDRVSAYGGILGLNRRCDLATAQVMVSEGTFFEAVVAPSYDPEAFEMLVKKPKWGKNLRLVQTDSQGKGLEFAVRPGRGLVLTGIRGGVLIQTPDDLLYESWESATTPPTEAQNRDLKLAWTVCKHVRSNAIVFVRDSRVVGVGSGQTSRLDSVEIAVRKAGERARGAVMASDAFFPFKDGVETAIRAGIQAIVHPGGSIRDEEVIECARAHGVPMILTKTRHFKH